MSQKYSNDDVKPPHWINDSPEFIASKQEQYQSCMDLINSSIASSAFADRAFGCIIGAFIGDSCGSYVEFDELYPSKFKIENCMKMPGGGHHGVAPGQVTDDGEMLMSLLMGYVESNKDVPEG